MTFYELINNIKADLSNFNIWHIDFANYNHLYLFSMLTNDEKALYYNYSRKKSKLEFLGGRVLVKLCISKYLSKDNAFDIRQISINRHKNGTPFLLVSNKKTENIHFSISHRKDYIFCAVDVHPIAVDVEKVSNKILRLTKYYLTPAEEKLIMQKQNSLSMIKLLTMIWSAKELVSKYLKDFHFMRVLKKAKLVDIKDNRLKIYFSEKNYEITLSIKAYFYKEYVFTYVVSSQ